MGSSKDTSEVANFMALYSKLKDWCDDEPEVIFQTALVDKKFKQLCMLILQAAEQLHASERRGRQLFAAPVDPKFLSSWRDFEIRYEHVLAANWSAFVFGEKRADGADESKSSTTTDRRWETADLNAKIAADLVRRTIGFARVQAFDNDDPLDLDYSMTAEQAVGMAIDYWDALEDEVGFDLAGVFRRRKLVPFVFFPRHIAARYGATEKALIYQSLMQAHDAFIFGVPFAAIALMRSVMETVLRDHYNAQGDNLAERINSVRKILPAGANVVALHRLRKSANAVLHRSAGEDQALSNFEPSRMEKELLSLLHVLRALIEGVSQWRRP